MNLVNFLCRQLRDTVDWIFSESMIIYYITLFKNSMWPNGKLGEFPASKTDHQKLQTRLEAKEKFLNNMPGKVLVILLCTSYKHNTLCIKHQFEVHLLVSVVAIEMKYFPLQLLIR